MYGMRMDPTGEYVRLVDILHYVWPEARITIWRSTEEVLFSMRFFFFPARRYVPILKHMPLKYLFQPWKAPKAVQERAQCIIGKDYPAPMIDHVVASKECKNRMQEVKAFYKESRKLASQFPHICLEYDYMY